MWLGRPRPRGWWLAARETAHCLPLCQYAAHTCSGCLLSLLQLPPLRLQMRPPSVIHEAPPHKNCVKTILFAPKLLARIPTSQHGFYGMDMLTRWCITHSVLSKLHNGRESLKLLKTTSGSNVKNSD